MALPGLQARELFHDGGVGTPCAGTIAIEDKALAVRTNGNGGGAVGLHPHHVVVDPGFQAGVVVANQAEQARAHVVDLALVLVAGAGEDGVAGSIRQRRWSAARCPPVSIGVDRSGVSVSRHIGRRRAIVLPRRGGRRQVGYGRAWNAGKEPACAGSAAFRGIGRTVAVWDRLAHASSKDRCCLRNQILDDSLRRSPPIRRTRRGCPSSTTLQVIFGGSVPGGQA